MKKLLATLFVLACFSVSAFAVDSVVVKRSGKAVRTETPIFSQITVASINYTQAGETTTNTLVVVAGSKLLTATITTASITNLGKALNTQGYAITGGSDITADQIDAVTGNFSADCIAPTGWFTTIYNTDLSTTKIITDGPLTFGASCPTAAATNVTANFSIPVTINGQLYKILLRD